MTDEKKTVLVVGASGYVGSHVTCALLDRGYRVRGTMRDTSKVGITNSLMCMHADAKNNLELRSLVMAEEALQPAVWDALCAGVDAAFFCAGFEHQDKSTIDFMVNNTASLMQAAKRSSLSTIVLTSSGGSTNPPNLPPNTPKNEIEHWSDPDLQIKNDRFSPAAKTLMELNAFKEVGRNARNEVVNACEGHVPRLCIMNPNLILGPDLRSETQGNSLPWLAKILRGETMHEIPNDSMSVIDVRDLAALHVACYERPSASGRYFGVDKSYPWEEILACFKELYPAYNMPSKDWMERKPVTLFDHARKESLGVPLRPLTETVRDLIAFFKARGEIP
eukprot:GEMP01045435.1.p1 GENE.GEMP01045435.1~~GEMP01045435.1.p1  ORF type:complete len:335 (-),score=76.61 GEMP01045435.1:581-1585(-)